MEDPYAVSRADSIAQGRTRRTLPLLDRRRPPALEGHGAAEATCGSRSARVWCRALLFHACQRGRGRYVSGSFPRRVRRSRVFKRPARLGFGIQELLSKSRATLPLSDSWAPINREKTGPLPVAIYLVFLMALTEGRCCSSAALGNPLHASGFASMEYRETAADRSVIRAKKRNRWSCAAQREYGPRHQAAGKHVTANPAGL
jgi:hypothetical protein